MSNQKVWVITAATRGLGAKMAEAALTAGTQVVATGPKPKAVTEALDTYLYLKERSSENAETQTRKK